MISQNLLPEFDHEMKSTRAVLALVPDDRFDFKPHPKSMSMGDLATHVANILYWAEMTLERDEFDVNPTGGAPLRRAPFGSTEEMLQSFDSMVANVRRKIDTTSDQTLLQPWSLKNNGNNVFTMPRVAVLRSFVMNHLIHHRGQLTVYLRLNDVPLPSVYGPTADM